MLSPASSEHFNVPGKINHSNGKIVFILNKSAFISYCIKEYPLSLVPAMEGKGNSYYNKQHLLRNTVSGPVVSTSPYSLTYPHNNPMKKALVLSILPWRRLGLEWDDMDWDHSSDIWLSWDLNPGSTTLKFMVLTPNTKQCFVLFWSLKKRTYC